MDRAGVGKVCLALPGATLDHPFGDDYDAWKVGGKMFARDDPADWPDAELAEHLAIAHGIVAAKLTKKARAVLGLT